MKLKVILIIFITLSIIGCKKENENKSIYTHNKISSSLYSFLFNNGSYWIYKKANSNILDSVIVQDITRSTFENLPSYPGQGSQGENEFFNIKYYSFYTDLLYEEQLFGYVISRSLYHGGLVLLTSKKIGDSIMNAKLISIIDTLTIENRKYKSVVKMKIMKDQYLNKNYNLYYVDSIGIIKKEITENNIVTESWNLIKFKTELLKYK